MQSRGTRAWGKARCWLEALAGRARFCRASQGFFSRTIPAFRELILCFCAVAYISFVLFVVAYIPLLGANGLWLFSRKKPYLF